MADSTRKIVGASAAALLAGSALVTAYAFASLYATVPAPIPFEPEWLLGFIAFLVPALMIGFLLSFIPAILCVEGLARIADRHAAFRAPLSWTAIGAALGAGAALLLDLFALDPELAVAVILATAACARTARAFVNWDDSEPTPGVVVTRPAR